MRCVTGSIVTLCVLAACSPPSTVGTGEGGTVPWTPGRYNLQATVGTGSVTDQEFDAILTVAPDGSIGLSSSTGLCVDPTQAATARDRERGERTFECGEAVYRVRSTPSGVRGEVLASILEEYTETVPCPTSSSGTCTVVRTRRVTRRANLTVNPLN
jgi:hypothetical protein